MYVPFQELPAQSRIWIYQTHRKLSVSEVELINQALQDFCNQWAAHGQSLRTSFTTEHNQFVILGTDEDYHQPSGCSIDSSVQALKQLGQQVNIDFFDRTKVAFWINDAVVTLPISELKKQFESGILKSNTITFDNLVPSKGDWNTRWKIPVNKSWLAKYLPKSALVS